MLSREQLLAVRYNPNAMQRLVLNNLENYSEGNYAVQDATNPFNMLLEAASSMAANSLLEAESIIRKKYPSLATDINELYHHITDNELTSMFATPAEATILFYVNVLDLKMYGHTPPGANYKEMTIPEDTTIEVLGNILTILNDINIKLYDNDTFYVEQQMGSNDLAYPTAEILPSNLTNSRTPNVSWITFTAKVKQVRKISVTSAIVATKGCSIDVPLNGYYVFSTITAGTGSNARTLSKSHTDDYIDPSNPTCYISLKDGAVNFSIPDMYINSFGINGNILIDMYETTGKMYVPLSSYDATKFTINLGKIGKTIATSVSKNIAMACMCKGNLEGGINGMTMEQVRSSIINNTTGDIDLPITDLQLQRYNELNGYKIYKVSDVITNRLYTANKNLPDISNSSNLEAKQDVYFNTVSFELENVKDNENIEIQDDYFIIKSGCLFRLDNGSYSLLDNEESDLIKKMNQVDLLNHFKENTYYYNPYYYVIRKDATYSYAEVYDLDQPKLENLRTLGKNQGVSQSVNIKNYMLTKTDIGYRLTLELNNNPDFESIPIDNIRVLVKLRLIGVNNFAYFQAKYDAPTKRWTTDIETNHSLDENSSLDLQNGDSDLFTKRFDLNVKLEVYTYTVDANIKDPTDFLVNEIRKEDEDQHVVVFSKEELAATFGKKLDHIWNRLYNSFTDRKYRKYTEDIPAVYNEDVYEVFPDTGGIFTCTPEGDIKYNILHKKGEPILDDNNEPVYKHKYGDVMLDENDQPIIDSMSGVVRYIDMLMLEYVFKIANALPYTRYLEETMASLQTYIVDDMNSINDVLIDNTNIMYRSFKSNRNVTVMIGTTTSTLPYKIKPTVTLYVDSTELSSTTISRYRKQIGYILDNHLNLNELNMENIRTDIKTALGSSIGAVKVENIDGKNSEVIKMVDDSSRLSLAKRLDVDKNNQTIVVYDFILNIEYV